MSENIHPVRAVASYLYLLLFFELILRLEHRFSRLEQVILVVLVCRFGYVYDVGDVLALGVEVLCLLIFFLSGAEEETVEHFVFYTLFATLGLHAFQR